MKSDLVQGFAVLDHFVDGNKTIRIGIPDAGGIPSCSRWLSGATPPDLNSPESRTPAGVPANARTLGRLNSKTDRMSLEISNFPGFPIAEIQRLVEFEHHFPDVRKMVPRRRFADHFVGVNKMVHAGGSEGWVVINTGARELEAWVEVNVVELLEA